jgi:hypothetical protein
MLTSMTSYRGCERLAHLGWDKRAAAAAAAMRIAGFVPQNRVAITRDGRVLQGTTPQGREGMT